MDKCTGIKEDKHGNTIIGEARKKREDLIFRPRKSKNYPGCKKFVFVSDWDPRNPDISKIIKENRTTLNE